MKLSMTGRLLAQRLLAQRLLAQRLLARRLLARRLLAGAAAAGALIAVGGASAAAYAPAAAELSIYLPNTSVAMDTPGVVLASWVSASEEATFNNVTVVFDLSGLEGVARVAPYEDPDCARPAGDRLVCTKEALVAQVEGMWMFDLQVTALPAAAEGDSGVLKVSISADGVKGSSATGTVRVGAGVDLAAGPEVQVSGDPGDKVAVPLRLRNAGEEPADGAVAVFYHDYAIYPDRQYSNCTYEGKELRTCRFDGEFEPGADYETSLAYQIGADAYAPGEQNNETTWMTPAEFDDFKAYLDHLGVSVGSAGTGDKLKLEETEFDPADQRTQVDTEPSNNWLYTRIKVTGENGVDLAAVGDTVTGAVGAEVTATVGVSNKGPATLYFRSGEPVNRINVEIPDGTTAQKVSDLCQVLEDDGTTGEYGKAGAAAYQCHTTILLRAGETQTFDFTLKVDEVIPEATGTVTINVSTAGAPASFTDDLDTSNDVAKLVVNPSGGTAGGDPGLPITGTPVGRIVVVGVAFLVVGTITIVATRRRAPKSAAQPR